MPQGWGLWLSLGKFGQRLWRTPAPRIVKQRRATHKFLVVVAPEVLANEVGGCFGSYSSENFGQRLRRTPAPQMVKQRRAADKFLVAVALGVFAGQVGGVVRGGDRREVERFLDWVGGGPPRSIEFKMHFVWSSKSVGMWYLPKSSLACNIPLDRKGLEGQAVAGGGHSSSGGIQLGMAVEMVPLCPQRTTRLSSVGGG